MKKRWSASAFLAVVACGGETDPAAIVDGNPPSGFYGLTITTTADTCTPARPTGNRGNTLVSTTESVLNIPMPFVEGMSARQDLPWSGTSSSDYMGCTGSTLDVAVTHKSNDSLEVDVTERWVGVSACRGSFKQSSELPSTDCTATRRFEFSLIATCPATMDGQRCD